MPGSSRKPNRTRRNVRPEADQQLIADLMEFIGRYVVVTDAQRLVLATYVIHTHIAHLCQQTPYIFIHSPEPECGKSRLMEVLELLVARPWMIVNPSDAVLFRKVHQSMPTLLWDEIDAVFAPKSAQYHEEQRGMLDQGHRRRGRVPRFIGEKVVEFNVYSAKVFAGIGTLPDTLSRRSIPIALKRRSADEPVQEFILLDVEGEAEALRERVEAWVERHGEAAAKARPTQGPAVREALVEILTGDRVDSQETMRMRLLRDTRAVFVEEYGRIGRPRRAIPTDALLERLHEMPESPWANYYGRQLDAKDLADLLRPYGVHPRLLNMKGSAGTRVHARGYRRDAHNDDAGLADAWRRYLGSDDVAEVTGGNGSPGDARPRRSLLPKKAELVS